MRMVRGAAVLAMSATTLAAMCAETVDTALPSAERVASYYEVDGLQAEVSGNVASITVHQSPDQLRRGGTMWAKMGPYVYLFSEATRRLMEENPGLAGVRVTTRSGTEVEVASALLARDELSDVLWRRSLNIAGQVRRDGTQRLSLVEDLIRWGEDHTTYEYNERYTRKR